MLGADRHRQPPVEDVPDQGHQHELLLEDVEHLADGASPRRTRTPCGPRRRCTPAGPCVGCPRRVRQQRPAAADIRSTAASPTLGNRDVADRASARSGGRPGGRRPPPAGRRWPRRAAPGCASRSAPLASTATTSTDPGRQADELDRTDPGRVLALAHHHRGVVGEPGRGSGWCRPASARALRGRGRRTSGSAGTGPGPAARPGRGCRRKTGSPCRSGSAPRWCRAGCRYPSRSRTPISLRTVADDTDMPGIRDTATDPTGWAVWMYSSTTARRMAALRSSSTLALKDTECQGR